MRLLLDRTLLPGREAVSPATLEGFTGIIQKPEKMLFNRMRFRLQDVELASVTDKTRRILLSGQIVGEHVDSERFKRELEWSTQGEEAGTFFSAP